MAFCAIKAAEETQDVLAETRTVLDHHLKNLTATFIAISPRGRSQQGSMCPKQDLFSSRFNHASGQNLSPLSTNVS